MKIMKYITRTLIGLGIFLFIILGFFLMASTILNYKPIKRDTFSSYHPTIIDDTLRILSWNIGYAGLGENMDFFYDGGSKTRDTEENTRKNLDSITDFISKRNVDIAMLQEVDFNSKRSYNTNQAVYISNAARLLSFYANNYNVRHVPIPLFDPMGKVESGMANMSKYVPERVEHIPYNTEEHWPVGMFSLDRCMLVSSLKTSSRYLMLVNTHNSAFDDDGELRKKEMGVLKEFIISEYKKGNYVIVGGDWNQNPPLNDSLVKYDVNAGTRFFRPLKIEKDFAPENWQWVTNGEPTNRFLDKKYTKGETQETLIDFFLLSPNVEVVNFRRFDLGYVHSDHHPIEIDVILK